MAVILTRQNMTGARGATPVGLGGDENTLGGGDLIPNDSGPVLAPPDDSISKILKMVPGEASVAYTAALALGNGQTDAKALPLVAFVLCAILIPMLLYRDGRSYSPPVKPEPLQVVFQLLAFAAWAVSIENPLAPWGLTIAGWIPALAILFLPIFGGFVVANAEPAGGQTNDSNPGE